MTKSLVREKSSHKPVVRKAAESASKTATRTTSNGNGKSTKRRKVSQTVARDSKETPKPKKEKVVRDSFTMPESEYELIAAIKKRCMASGLAVKKSEVLRAAISGFSGQSDQYIKAAITSLEVIKTGRPPKSRK